MNVHPLETEHGQRALFLLNAAGTQAEWRIAVANLLLLLLADWQASNAAPDLGALDRWRAQREQLYAQIAAGLPVKASRPRKLWQVAGDTFFLQGREADFGGATDALARLERINPANARKRIKAAESLAGARLPRRKRFGKPWL